jgi:hypothetical protein
MTPAQILPAICPALAVDPNVAIFLQLAEEETSSAFFGISYSRAVALKAAHMYVLSKRSLGEGGAVTSKSEGKLSMSFSQQGGSSEDLSQTNYGKQLLGLIQSGTTAISVTDAGFE